MRSAFAPHARIVLAISGGLDSMVLLDAAASVDDERIAAVASFDHGTGAAAERAVTLVEQRAAELRLPFRSARAAGPLRGEAAWRDARWAFLTGVGRELGARVSTAHTDDDQLETVVMRILREAGARGLAGLYAPSPIVRPFLYTARETLERYAAVRAVRWVIDPSNASPAYFRNRVRHELLPAFRRVNPAIDEELRSVAREAAEWRRSLERAIETIPVRITKGGSLRVAAVGLEGYDRESLRVVWPALAARAGVRLDRRGTHRLAEFTRTCSRGTIQLAGGWEVIRTPESLVVRRAAAMDSAEHALHEGLEIGGFRFRRVSKTGQDDLWAAALPAGVPVTVRPWRAGDRMRAGAAGAPRRVKRFLSDAGIGGAERVGWPVVLAAGEVVWIPGIRRSDAATVRSGRPAVCYLCDRLDL